MAQWGNTDNAANSVTWAAAQLNKPANTTNQTALYGNTTMGAIVPKQVVSQVGISPAEDTTAISHAGWNLKTTGTGSLATLTITAGGTGYSNTDTIRVAATGTGSVNATATLTTNATGGIASVTITNAGSGFTVAAPTVAFANSTGGATLGTGATVVAAAGGRAGRVSYETLVATGSLT